MRRTAISGSSEDARIRALEALDLIGRAPDPALDALTALTRHLFGTPVGLVTLIDRDRQWSISGPGSIQSPIARSESFCQHTIAQAGPLIVRDASLDTRFDALEAVTGAPHVRFYAGVPISAADPISGARLPIGAVCVMDHAPRDMTAQDIDALEQIRVIAENLLHARLALGTAEQQAGALRRRDRSFGQAERMSAMGSWRVDLADDSVSWSEGVYRIHEVEPGSGIALPDALDYFPPHARAIVTGSLSRTIETGEPFDFETDFITARGRHRRVRSIGEVELASGVPVAVVGVFQDITERFEIEQSLRRSASIDVLTGIANRAAFTVELERAMEAAQRDDLPLALVLIDVDSFKTVNDRHGHLAGDDVLRAFGRRLSRRSDAAFAARLGGDEFALIVSGRDNAAVAALAERLLADLKLPVRSGAGTLRTSGTIGYAMLDAGPVSMREFVHRADSALYTAKRRQRGTAQCYGTQRATDSRAA